MNANFITIVLCSVHTVLGPRKYDCSKESNGKETGKTQIQIEHLSHSIVKQTATRCRPTIRRLVPHHHQETIAASQQNAKEKMRGEGAGGAAKG